MFKVLKNASNIVSNIKTKSSNQHLQKINNFYIFDIMRSMSEILHELNEEEYLQLKKWLHQYIQFD